ETGDDARRGRSRGARVCAARPRRGGRTREGRSAHRERAALRGRGPPRDRRRGGTSPQGARRSAVRDAPERARQPRRRGGDRGRGGHGVRVEATEPSWLLEAVRARVESFSDGEVVPRIWRKD